MYRVFVYVFVFTKPMMKKNNINCELQTYSLKSKIQLPSRRWRTLDSEEKVCPSIFCGDCGLVGSAFTAVVSVVAGRVKAQSEDFWDFARRAAPSTISRRCRNISCAPTVRKANKTGHVCPSCHTE